MSGAVDPARSAPDETYPSPSLATRLTAVASRLLIRRVMAAPTLDLARLRRAMRARRLLPARLPRAVAVAPTTIGGVVGEWCRPRGADPARAILYLHGGAYVAGRIEDFRPFATWLAQRSGIAVCSLAYRLAPEHPFPAALDDALAAVRALLAQGIPASRLALVGDSAGGGLALATTLALRETGEPRPAALAVLSPLTDMAATDGSRRTNAARDDVLSLRHAETLARWYAGATPLDAPLLSPVRADLTGFPPTLIHVSDAEVLLDDATRLAERLRGVGVPVELEVWPGLPHDWHASVPLTREAREAVQRVGVFLAQQLGATNG
ncbi:MAG: alpha/beta hydrolase [Gemmatimonadaceae bacterium]